jgi:formylglycine-generating enzyme required for sulfatase activity
LSPLSWRKEAGLEPERRAHREPEAQGQGEREMEARRQAELAALEALKNDHFRTRASALNALAQSGPQFLQPIIGMLADDYPQVRVAAIRALEKLQSTGEWRKHLKYECYVPAGNFLMGDDNGDANEKPAHEVFVEAFYVGKYLVTKAEYKCFTGDTEQPGDSATGKADHPVVGVTWREACDYAHWADLRLLTEAEWEKAAGWQEGRGPKKLKFPWGDEFDRKKCNTTELGIGTTTPVGQYSPQGDSPYGCADMGGNAWEWTSSLYQGYPYKADDGREDAASIDRRVARGGSFNTSGNEARASFRGRGPGLVWSDIGIRCGLGSLG